MHLYNNVFEKKYYKDICPDELELKKEDKDLCKPRFCTFQ